MSRRGERGVRRAFCAREVALSGVKLYGLQAVIQSNDNIIKLF